MMIYKRVVALMHISNTKLYWMVMPINMPDFKELKKELTIYDPNGNTQPTKIKFIGRIAKSKEYNHYETLKSKLLTFDQKRSKYVFLGKHIE